MPDTGSDPKVAQRGTFPTFLKAHDWSLKKRYRPGSNRDRAAYVVKVSR